MKSFGPMGQVAQEGFPAGLASMADRPLHHPGRFFRRALLQLERGHRLHQRSGPPFQIDGLRHRAGGHAGIALRDFIQLAHGGRDFSQASALFAAGSGDQRHVRGDMAYSRHDGFNVGSGFANFLCAGRDMA